MVIFGGVSVFLAVASLAVSSIQAWAAFHPPGNWFGGISYVEITGVGIWKTFTSLLLFSNLP